MRLPDLARGHVLHRFQTWLYEFIQINNVEAIAVEAAVEGNNNPKYRNPQTHRMLLGLVSAAETIAAARSIPYHEVAVSTARKNFVGHGFPQNPKRVVSERCKLLGWPTPNYDATDALCVWAWLKMTKDPTFRLETATPLFGRGAA